MSIAILLSTYNGADFITQQLDSLFEQSHASFEVFVRDDGSQDGTLEVLKGYDVKLLPSDVNLGSRESFAALLNYAVSNSDADYFMFCDQDDVWYANKVEKTLAKMKQMEAQYGDVPLLVHTDLEVVDELLNTIAPSMWQYEHTLPEKNAFSRLLIQNTVTGCTVMINRALAEKCLTIPNGAIMHDWWLGLVASQFGKIGFITEPTIKYRQHGKNTIGAKGFKVNPLHMVLGLIYSLVFRDQDYLKHLQVNIDQARSFLDVFVDEIDDKNKALITDFITLEQKSFFQRRVVIYKHRLLKQGFLRNVALFVKV
ncbi:glycosyltransferase family 2 protein [Thiomicrospira sp.]|uniref:glycosyltransferase family 2 protein n=1 Tax=Thiomicrospira sp. TaxID=935 RepID=UPI002F940972